MPEWSEDQETLFPIKFPIEHHTVQEGEDDPFAYSTEKICNYLPEKKPITRREKLDFIYGFSRHGGGLYGRRTYAVNIKLWSAVRVPKSLNEGDWYDSVMTEFWDWSCRDLIDEFKQVHRGYEVYTQGRSGGWLALFKGRKAIDDWQDLSAEWMNYDGEYYEKLFVPVEKWEEKWNAVRSRYSKLKINGVYAPFYKALNTVLDRKKVRLFSSTSRANTYKLASEFHKKWQFMWEDVYRLPISKRIPFIEDFIRTSSELIQMIHGKLPEEHLIAVAIAVNDTYEEFKQKSDSDMEMALIELKSQFIKKYGKCPEQLPVAESFDDEDVDDMFDLLWDFLSLAHLMAHDFVYNIYDYHTQKQAE